MAAPQTRMGAGRSVAAWERIAQSFSETRNRPWDQVLDFLEALPTNATLLDVGCGNARHATIARNRGMNVVAVDASLELVRVTHRRLAETKAPEGSGAALVGTATDLPLARNSVDHALFIAALHNVPGRDQRVKALREVRRVMRPRGMALISVWARWQDRFADHYVKELFRHLPRRIAQGRDAPEFGDILIPWKGEVMRFYHLMSLRESIVTCKAAGFFIKDAWSAKLASQWLPDNHFIVVEKPRPVREE